LFFDDRVNFSCIIYLLLAGLTLTPLVVKINPNVNVLLTASITVFVGCYRSVKPTPPSVSSIFYPRFLPSCFKNHYLTYMSCVAIMQEIMSNQRAIRFPFVGSALLLSLFLLFKFLSKDLVNAVFTLLFFVVGIVNLSYILYFSQLRFF
jgi:minor histocompatibility antigen H13